MKGTGKEQRVETSERGSKVCDGPAIHQTRPSIGLVESTVETKGCVPCRRSFVSNRDPRPWAGWELNHALLESTVMISDYDCCEWLMVSGSEADRGKAKEP
ncbi:hypothetical protein F2Q69_00036801 [Brassica cretica]|uniref:Uncharacterized protein n=1 Tax=Brassica cretica TaxID=69181 RepID=A0A8S9SE25_BRACR|nr:hypothetical protein F2Q69_00036801 [Brassica cretica]